MVITIGSIAVMVITIGSVTVTIVVSVIVVVPIDFTAMVVVPILAIASRTGATAATTIAMFGTCHMIIVTVVVAVASADPFRR